MMGKKGMSETKTNKREEVNRQGQWIKAWSR